MGGMVIMKILYFMLFVIFVPCVALGDEPSTSCPTGFIAINEPYITISDSACPDGYTSTGTAMSCLVASPSGVCIMYVPSGVVYTDTTGTYQFTEICPLI